MADVLDTTQQIVLSVRVKGDKGPQTGDVVLGGMSIGDFNSTMGYDKNEVVIKDKAIYRALKQIDANVPWNDDYWEALTNVQIYLKDFEPNHFYEKNQIILYNESLYRALNSFTSATDFDVKDWEGIDTVDVDVQDFKINNPYDKYETIVHNGLLYRAKEAFTSIGVFVESDWELISDLKVQDFEINKDYKRNNLVAVAGVLYRALNDFTSSTSFDPDDWERLNVTGVNEFLPDEYYVKGSMITRDGKLYLAKQDFTSGNAFDINDWERQDDVQVGGFQTYEYYPKDHIIFYRGKLWRARADFTSTGSWDATKWEYIDPAIIDTFTSNTSYLAGQPTIYQGNLYIAKTNFTSGTNFDPTNWNEMAVHTLQVIYENSSNTFTDPTEVYPTSTFDERIYAPGGGGYILNQTDNSGGTETVKTQVNAAAGGYSTIKSSQTSMTVGSEVYEAKMQNSILTVGVKRAGGFPYSFISMKDNDSEQFTMDVNDVNSSVTFTANIQKAFTDALCVASKTQLGVVKVDGQTVRIDSNGVITAYSIFPNFQSNTEYHTGEVVLHNSKVWASKNDFTSGTSFDVSNWNAVRPVVETYTSGATYAVGDLIRVNNQLYYCNTAISNAPGTRNNAHWTAIQVDGSNVVIDISGNLVATSTNLNTSIKRLDSKAYYAVQPQDGMTQYLLMTQTAGSAAPAAVAGKTIICIWTE